MDKPLAGLVALATGATRGAGRAIALELALAGAKVYATGRSTRTSSSAMARPETIDETGEIIGAAGGTAVALEANWREAIAKDRHFAASETPRYLGRAIVALACDPNIMQRSDQALATWNLAKEYGLTDVDGSQPDWGAHARRVLGGDFG